MKQDSEFSLQDYVEAYNQRSDEMTAAYQSACILLGKARALEDIERLRQPPPPPLVVQAGRWLGRQARRMRHMVSPQPAVGPDLPAGMPNEDGVIVIDAEYRVLDPEHNGTARPPGGAGGHRWHQ